MRKAIDLLESVIDLQLGNIDMDTWLQSLAMQTGAGSAVAASWPAQKPKLAIINSSNKVFSLTPEWLSAVDNIITVANPEQPELLDDIARSAKLLDDAPDALLKDSSWMVAFLDSYPACTVLALHCPDDQDGWKNFDRSIFRKVLPVLLKAHLLQKQIVLTDNKLKIANKILDSSPRCVITLTPTGEILHKNSMASDFLKQDSSFSERNGYLKIKNAKVSSQLEEKLAEIRALPLDSLRELVWNRSFSNEKAGQIYQLAISAHALEGWRMESNPHDRFIVLFLSSTDFNTLPTTEQLGDFYDLTAAQARLVIALMEGKSIEAAAAHLNVSVNTIRSHLRAIYSKVGTTSKTGLIRIVSATLVGYSTTPS